LLVYSGFASVFGRKNNVEHYKRVGIALAPTFLDGTHQRGLKRPVLFLQGIALEKQFRRNRLIARTADLPVNMRRPEPLAVVDWIPDRVNRLELIIPCLVGEQAGAIAEIVPFGVGAFDIAMPDFLPRACQRLDMLPLPSVIRLLAGDTRHSIPIIVAISQVGTVGIGLLGQPVGIIVGEAGGLGEGILQTGEPIGIVIAIGVGLVGRTRDDHGGAPGSIIEGVGNRSVGRSDLSKPVRRIVGVARRPRAVWLDTNPTFQIVFITQSLTKRWSPQALMSAVNLFGQFPAQIVFIVPLQVVLMILKPN
jgi:hypothetical protein